MKKMSVDANEFEEEEDDEDEGADDDSVLEKDS